MTGSTDRVKLYGGAITSTIPLGFVDVSMFRQVPDTQEVFVSNEDGCDDSVVFDILERVDASSDKQAVSDHIEELSILNNAGENYMTLTLESVDMKKQKNKDGNEFTPACYLTVAVEPSKKWGKEEVNSETGEKPLVVLIVGVIRLESVSSDILITYNLPITASREISDLESIVKESTSGISSGNTLPVAQRIEDARFRVKESLNNFVIQDWELFGE